MRLSLIFGLALQINDRPDAPSNASMIEVVVALNNDGNIRPQQETSAIQMAITSKPEYGVA